MTLEALFSFTLVVSARVLNLILLFFFVIRVENRHVCWIFQLECSRNLSIDYNFVRSCMSELDVFKDICFYKKKEMDYEMDTLVMR